MKKSPGTYAVMILVSVPDLNDDGRMDEIDDTIRHAIDNIEAREWGTVVSPVAGEDRHGPTRCDFYSGGTDNKTDPDYIAWRAQYGHAVDGPESVECEECRARVEGDGAPVSIVCWVCFKADSVGKKLEAVNLWGGL